MINNAKVKYNYDQMKFLVHLYAALVGIGEEQGKELLYRHNLEFHRRLQLQLLKMAANNQDSYRLTMDARDCQAVMDSWEVSPFPMDPYNENIIRLLFEVAHRFIVNNPVLVCAE